MSGPDVEKLCAAGRQHLRSKDLAAAADDFKKAITLDADSSEAHEGLATSAYMSGDYQTAIAEFLRLTMLQPLESRFYTNLGAIHNRLGDHMKAADFLRKAIARNKKCAESFYNLGIAQRKLKQNSMAVSAYKEAIKLDPNMAEAHQNLGNVYVDMGNLQLAVASFKKALEIRPGFEKALAGLEKAEQQLAAARLQNTQMGRLNAMSSTVTNVAPVSTRDLDDEERYADRKFLTDLAEEIEQLAKSSVEHLRLHVIPAVLEVERAMGHGSDEIHVLNEAAQLLRTATSQWAALRRSIKRKVAELDTHEQSMGAAVGQHSS